MPSHLRLSLVLIRVAAVFVPKHRRTVWREQWEAELFHRWQRSSETPTSGRSLSRSMILWSTGAFAHAWYLLRTEYTMDIILQDIKYGLRALRRGKGLIWHIRTL